MDIQKINQYKSSFDSFIRTTIDDKSNNEDNHFRDLAKIVFTNSKQISL